MNHTITVEKIINGGKGLGRLDDGMVVMVPFVLPGETVEVVEKKRFSGYLAAEVQQLTLASPERKAPPCQFYGTCGGCDLQHCSYSLQQQIKQEILLEALQRSGVVCDEEVLQALIPSEDSFSYRYRLRLKLSKLDGLGFFKAGTNTVVPIDSCPVATEKINLVLRELQQNWETLSPLSSSCREIELLHSPADAKVICLVHISKKQQQNQPCLERLAEFNSLDDLLIKQGNKVGSFKKGLKPQSQRSQQLLSQEFRNNKYVPPYTLSWGAGCFSQVNPAQNEKLTELVCQLCGDLKGKRVLELYCGIGNFTVPLALCGAEGIGVEHNKQSLRWASANLAAAEVAPKRWKLRDERVDDALSRLKKNNQEFDCIVCDPPRIGLGKEAALVASLGAKRIVYVSCDPATLARDLKTISAAGYRVSFLTPVDMFPQTHHIESVTLLEKN